jgi:hypothetical protein
MEHIFARLPDRLFSPLAGPNRGIYATLLLDLYGLFFDQIHADVFPARETVRYEIEEHLARLSLRWQEDSEDQAQSTEDMSPAATVYRRLRDAGWLEEESEGYRVHVAVPPAVAMVWATLMEVARPDKVFYGGMVLSIHNNLRQALDAPQEQALALRQAASEAKRFSQHLNAMIYGLKGMLEQLRGHDDHRRVLSGFFDDFVDHFLVQDYKRLTTRNNPFRYRQQILDGVRELEFDIERKELIVAGYMSQTGEGDSETAWNEVNADIDRLRRTFEQVDAHLGRINRYRGRVEGRVADTVRYLDRTQPGQSARLARLCQDLAPRVTDLEDQAEIDWLPVLQPPPIGVFSLYEPHRTRRPPEPGPLQSRAPDPAVQARQAALRAYLDRRRIDPRRIEGYLEAQLGDGGTIDGRAMTIGSVEDFIAFTHLRHLPYLDGAARLRRRYLVERTGDCIDNDWVRCPGFVVHRRTRGESDAA